MMISLVARCLPPGRACQVPVSLCGLHRGGAGGGPQCAGALPGRGAQVGTQNNQLPTLSKIKNYLIIFQSRNNGNYVPDAFCRIGKS